MLPCSLKRNWYRSPVVLSSRSAPRDCDGTDAGRQDQLLRETRSGNSTRLTIRRDVRISDSGKCLSYQVRFINSIMVSDSLITLRQSGAAQDTPVISQRVSKHPTTVLTHLIGQYICEAEESYTAFDSVSVVASVGRPYRTRSPLKKGNRECSSIG